MTSIPSAVLVVTAMLPTPSNPVRGVVVEREIADLRGEGLEVLVVDKAPGALGYLSQWWRAMALLRKRPVPVVHAHFGTSGLVAALLPKRHRLVVTLHGSDVTYGPGFTPSRHWLQYWMSVIAAWRADAVVVQAEFMRERLPDRLRRRVVVLPQAVAQEFPAPSADRDARAVLFLADARRPVKRASLAHAAMRELGDLDLQMQSLDAVERPQIPATMARARMGVLTSVREGLPVACREALVSGLPVVVVDLPGTRELAACIPEGVVVVEADPLAVADGLRRLARATEGSRGEELSQRLRTRTRELGWGSADHMERLLACYSGDQRGR